MVTKAEPPEVVVFALDKGKWVRVLGAFWSASRGAYWVTFEEGRRDWRGEHQVRFQGRIPMLIDTQT